MGNNVNWERRIPLEVSSVYMEKLLKNPIVSVGSGLGKYEKQIETQLNTSIICVDPNPTSYNYLFEDEDTKNLHLPDYSTVDALLHKRPELIGNCNLLLAWPLPNDSEYDIEAVVKLKPLNMVIIYETIGGAAGKQMHIWLNTIGAPNGIRLNDPTPLKSEFAVDLSDAHYKCLSVYEIGTRLFSEQTFCMAFISRQKDLDVSQLPKKLASGYDNGCEDDDYYDKLICGIQNISGNIV
jgi:hypothetical protein